MTRLKGIAGILLAAVALLAHGAARADTQYTLQVIARLGDDMGGVLSDADGDFEIGTLNDAGQLVFVTETTARSEMVVRYADGKLEPVAFAGGQGPLGVWPADLATTWGASMNQEGNIVFGLAEYPFLDEIFGTFRWESSTRKLTTLAVKGMPVLENESFRQGGFWCPMINNRDEVVLPAVLQDNQSSLFICHLDGTFTPLVLSGQDLGDGKTLGSATYPTINDAGAVAFVTSATLGSVHTGAYLWENGLITRIAAAGDLGPDGRSFNSFPRAWVNNHDRNVLLMARLDNGGGLYSFGLYRFVENKLLSVLAPGDAMPGGDQLGRTVFLNGLADVSYANDRGEHAFVAQLTNSAGAGPATGLYLLEPDGKLSLVLKSGTDTELGRILAVVRGSSSASAASLGVGLNNKGQMAVTVWLDEGDRVSYALILLTPVTS